MLFPNSVGQANEAARHRHSLPKIACNSDGVKLKPPTLRLVGSKVIQPAPDI